MTLVLDHQPNGTRDAIIVPRWSGDGDANRRNVLRLIRSRGPLSRQQVSELTGLSMVTVGKIAKDYMRAGLLVEDGPNQSTGGRPAGILRLRPDSGHVVGILLGAEMTTGVVMDLLGTVQFMRVWEEPPLDGEAAIQRLELRTRELIESSGVPADTLLGVGIGCPGLIDAVEGRCIESFSLGWRNLDLVAPLETRLGLPVLIDNNVNCLTTYELLFGELQGSKNALVISVGSGLGLGVVVDGLVYRGSMGIAGEIGHVPVLGSQRECGCGRLGCIEAHVTDRGIVSNYMARVPLAAVQTGDVMDLALNGDPAAVAALRDGGALLGSAVGALAQIFDPDQVLLVVVDRIGKVRVANYLDAVRTEYAAQLAGRPGAPPLTLSTVAYPSWAQGAGSIALNQVFTPGALTSSRLSERLAGL